MGHTEEKNKLLIQLQQEVTLATKEQAKAASDYSSKSATLTAKVAIYDQDIKDVAEGQINLKSADAVLRMSESMLVEVQAADEKTQKFYASILELFNRTYHTARQTVAAAREISELAAHIDKTKTKNKLISDLLVADAKKATTDAAKAVADVITALNDCMTAAALTLQLTLSLESTNSQVDIIAGIISDKKDGLHHSLYDLHEKTEARKHEALENKAKANTAAAEAKRLLDKENSNLNSIQAAFNAANAAVSV